MAAPVLMELEAEIEWRATRSPDSNRWIGVCDAMNLVTEADSLDELHSVIHEAMQLLLIDLLEDDELDPFLRERGWRRVNASARHRGRDVKFNFPWQLIAEGAGGPERRAH